MKKRIESLAPGGRYILSSANSLPNYVKPANVRAMGEALLKYGVYREEDRKRAKTPVIRSAAETIQSGADQGVSKTPGAEQADPIQRIRNAVILQKNNDTELSGSR